MFKNMKKPCKYVVFTVSTRFYGKAADGNRTRKIQRFYAVSRLRVAFRVAYFRRWYIIWKRQS